MHPVPFLCIPFAWLVARGGRILRDVATGLLAASAVFVCAVALTGMTQPSNEPNLWAYVFSRLLRGELTAIRFAEMGFDPKPFFLLVLVVVFAVASALIMYAANRTGTR